MQDAKIWPRAPARPSRSTRLREHLQERVELDLVEDPVHDIRVAADDRPGVGERVGLEHDEAAAAVGEGTGERHSPGDGRPPDALTSIVIVPVTFYEIIKITSCAFNR